MTRDTKTGLGFGLVAVLLGGCAPIGLIASFGGSALAGTFFVRGQTVERTFVSPMPEVKDACRRALEVMALTITQEGPYGKEYLIFAAAPPQYEVEVTITPITSKATRVSVNADSLPERDKATGLEILNQTAAALSPSPPSQAFVASNGAAQSPTTALRSVVHPEPSSVRLTAGVEMSPSPKSPPVEHEERMKPEEIYDMAINEYTRGDFPAAIAHLRTYLAAKPHSAQKPKALYLLGESLYSQREYTDALLQFETILQDYPQSPEIPRALLKSA
ncbi:MAG: tetratricopeptide repeat protein, partial [candidate division NC10 bacterium]|nr:tetratricopeptide repeat protein [candidate division NC10 bacterium]